MREIISDPPSIPDRICAQRKSLPQAINSKSDLANFSSSDSENEKPAVKKAHRKPKTAKATIKNSETSAQSSVRKKTQIGSFVFSDSSDGSFVEFRKGYHPSKTISVLQTDRAEMWKENNFPTKNLEDADSNSSNIKKLPKQMVPFEKPTSISIKTATDARITFDNCESVTKCLQQGKHKICGHDFLVWAATPTKSMKKSLRANLEQSMPATSSESNLGNQLSQATA
ncbi:hypothetical protein Ddc_19906 [Ditylenchus destructor]|nr:hypothetical protein Ddc_19906 [Ditylenchus destructor]